MENISQTTLFYLLTLFFILAEDGVLALFILLLVSCAVRECVRITTTTAACFYMCIVAYSYVHSSFIILDDA